MTDLHALMPQTIWMVVTTVADEAQARALARTLVEEGLAACVQIEPIASVYRWQQAVQETAEWRLCCKTAQAQVPCLLAHLRAHHPYDVPQLLAQPLAASADYAAWVGEAVSDHG